MNYMESFENIKIEMRQKMNLEVENSILTQINAIVKDSYKLYRDPLGNLVVGLPIRFECIKMRKFNVRKELFAYIHKNSEEMVEFNEIFLDLPEA